MNVTERQIKMMKHALGLNYSTEQTRNYFYCETNNPEWNDLVAKGYATKLRAWDDESAYFRVTEEGIRLIESLIKPNQ